MEEHEMVEALCRNEDVRHSVVPEDIWTSDCFDGFESGRYIIDDKNKLIRFI